MSFSPIQEVRQMSALTEMLRHATIAARNINGCGNNFKRSLAKKQKAKSTALLSSARIIFTKRFWIVTHQLTRLRINNTFFFSLVIWLYKHPAWPLQFTKKGKVQLSMTISNVNEVNTKPKTFASLNYGCKLFIGSYHCLFLQTVPEVSTVSYREQRSLLGTCI